MQVFELKALLAKLPPESKRAQRIRRIISHIESPPTGNLKNANDPKSLPLPPLDPICRHDEHGPIVFKINETALYGLRKCDAPYLETDLYLDCSNSEVGSIPFMCPPEYAALQKYDLRHNNVIYAPWPDYSAPRLALGFWRDLATMFTAAPAQSVAIFCVGSHGRTGTALSLLYMFSHKVRAKNAVAFVRKHHCEKAVECMGQYQYLLLAEEMLFGDCKTTIAEIERPPEAKISKGYGKKYYSGVSYSSKGSYNSDHPNGDDPDPNDPESWL